MTSTIWSIAILVFAIAGLFGFRNLSNRARFAFDLVCLVALSAVLYQRGGMSLFEPSVAASAASHIWLRAVIVVWWILSARIVVGLLYFTVRHDRRSREARLFFDLVAAAIYICTVLIVLKLVLALPVGGLLATSGVVAIVLGLALQNSLADVFAGIAVGIERPFQVGDRISLESIEGQVTEINWRSIRVQTDGDDIAIIPNSLVAKQLMVNRSFPSRRRSVSVEVWCPAAADPERVVDVLQQATMLCPSILETPEPGVSLNRMGPSWNRYTVSFSVADTPLVTATKSHLLRHARKQLHNARLLGPSQLPSASPVDSRTPSVILPVRQILHELLVFECLQPEQLDALARRAETRLLEPGEILFAQGAADATLYVIASGIVEVTRETDTSSTVTLGCLGAGEYVGEICLLTGAPHAATARARTHCYIHQLSRDAIGPLLAANAEMAAAFDKSVRRGLDILQRSVAARAAENVGAQGQLLQRIRAFFHFRPAE
jgi:small-conductance mechanosensitive channel/CRP-like cAMP-binding protein